MVGQIAAGGLAGDEDIVKVSVCEKRVGFGSHPFDGGYRVVDGGGQAGFRREAVLGCDYDGVEVGGEAEAGVV